MGIFSFLGILLEVYKEIRRAVRRYRKALREGWIEEHRKISEAIEHAESDEDRRRLLGQLAVLLRNRPGERPEN